MGALETLELEESKTTYTSSGVEESGKKVCLTKTLSIARFKIQLIFIVLF